MLTLLPAGRLGWPYDSWGSSSYPEPTISLVCGGIRDNILKMSRSCNDENVQNFADGLVLNSSL